ncbi:L,D-transpeptidase family protein [Pedobacter steynii]|nr:L,D-transpeptidase family protein [Pedobacter steynii]
MMTSSASAQLTFKQQQLTFPRVRGAYEDSWISLQNQLKTAKFDGPLQLYIAAYKTEGLLEVWAKRTKDKEYRLFKTYKFCAHSGTLGPKVQEGDYQTPEGIYYINIFNPMSNFHLSLGVNYPNSVDKKRSGSKPTGGDIYIHGNCVTVGCIPLTDEKIKEVYVLAVEAQNSGQTQIPVHIFPFKMNKANLDKFAVKFPQQKAFWASLQPAYQLFEQHKIVPHTLISEGKYTFK